MLSPARAPSSGVPTLQDMSEEVELLREENAQLKRELALNRDRDLEAAFSARWKLTVQEAKLVSHLYRRSGNLVTKESLLHAMYGGRADDAPEIKIIDVFVCKARRKMGGDPIQTIWGRGYGLTAYGLERCAETLCWFKQPDAVALEPEEPPVARIQKQQTDSRYLKIGRILNASPSTARQLADAMETDTHPVNTALATLRKRGLLDVVDLVRGQTRALNVYGLTKAGVQWVQERSGIDA